MKIEGETYVTYTEPAKGSAAGANPDRDSPVPDGAIRTGIIHSHAAYDTAYQNNIFSPSDKNYAEKRNVDVYVATPSGTLQSYDVTFDKESTIDSDVPYDSKDVDRMENNIIPDKPR